jgi:hypothetical protein
LAKAGIFIATLILQLKLEAIQKLKEAVMFSHDSLFV